MAPEKILKYLESTMLDALELCAHGLPVENVAKRLGVPRSTLREAWGSESDSDESLSLKSSSGGSNLCDDDSDDELTLPPCKKENGEFGAVRYDENIFPGVITEVHSTGARVKSMQRNGRLWKWPDREDVLFYSWGDIMGQIRPPVKFSSRREIFAVPELENLY